MRESIKLLIKALESGEYIQGNGYLRADGKHCCLGVACELYQKQIGGLVEQEEDLTGRSINDISSFDGHTSFLPSRVKEWLGFITDEGSFDGISQYDNGAGAFLSLVTLNDIGMSFNDIAAVLKYEPTGMFVEEVNAR